MEGEKSRRPPTSSRPGQVKVNDALETQPHLADLRQPQTVHENEASLKSKARQRYMSDTGRNCNLCKHVTLFPDTVMTDFLS